MQDSWLGIGLMALVVCVGLITSIVLSKNKAQRRASIVAFILLALILLAFFIVVVVYNIETLLYVFAGASLVIPLIFYLLFAVVGARSSEKKANKFSQAQTGPIGRLPAAEKRQSGAFKPLSEPRNSGAFKPVGDSRQPGLIQPIGNGKQTGIIKQEGDSKPLSMVKPPNEAKQPGGGKPITPGRQNSFDWDGKGKKSPSKPFMDSVIPGEKDSKQPKHSAHAAQKRKGKGAAQVTAPMSAITKAGVAAVTTAATASGAGAAAANTKAAAASAAAPVSTTTKAASAITRAASKVAATVNGSSAASQGNHARTPGSPPPMTAEQRAASRFAPDPASKIESRYNPAIQSEREKDFSFDGLAEKIKEKMQASPADSSKSEWATQLEQAAAPKTAPDFEPGSENTPVSGQYPSPTQGQPQMPTSAQMAAPQPQGQPQGQPQPDFYYQQQHPSEYQQPFPQGYPPAYVPEYQQPYAAGYGQPYAQEYHQPFPQGAQQPYPQSYPYPQEYQQPYASGFPQPQPFEYPGAYTTSNPHVPYPSVHQQPYTPGVSSGYNQDFGGDRGFVPGMQPPTSYDQPYMQAAVPEPVAVNSEASFELSLAKADLLKEKHGFADAAGFYLESAELASDNKQARKAIFEAIACYVKADMRSEAQRCAAMLHNSVDEMNPIEVMKLDAVLRND